MGDPLRDVDVAPLVASDEPEEWLVRRTPNSWDVWIYADERRPRRLKDIRGKVAAITAGVIIGVLGLGGIISYAVTWQGREDQASALLSADTMQVVQSIWGDRTIQPADPQEFLDLAVRSVDTPDGAFGVRDGRATTWTPTAAAAAADGPFVADVAKASDDGSVVTRTYSSPSSAYAYTVIPIIVSDGTTVDVVRVIDLTPDRGRLNQEYLRYGLGSLAGAGAAAGTVWWGLGRRRKSTGEPGEV